MNENEPPQKAQPFEQRTIVIAALACFVSLIFLFLVGKPLVERPKVAWAELIVCAILPILVTFAIFYCSSWNPEAKGAARVASVLLRSLFILVVEIVVAGLTFCLTWLVFNALSGNGGHHP